MKHSVTASLSKRELSKIIVPFWGGRGLAGTLQNSGAGEASISTAFKYKKITLISETGIHHWAYNKEFLEKLRALYDHWLKGIDNDIMDQLPVELMIRTGYSGYY